jgi:putative transposase
MLRVVPEAWYSAGMPVRNIYKDYAPESYYHIYNRGVNKDKIFLDERDYATFLSLIKRYLGTEASRRQNYQFYPNYYGAVELLAYCLMPNHFHLFIYQIETSAMTNFMKSLSVAYCMYFNRRYKRVGPVFQQRYKAVRIIDDSQLLHITRYMHMNPEDYRDYEWSSLGYYLSHRSADWLRPKRMLELFNNDSYADFLGEYEDRRAELKDTKEQLANA